jgi:hypothetical protein
MSIYEDTDSINLLNKYEFSKRAVQKDFIYQEPHQVLLRNFISKPTIYENILLYHHLGSGKTCTSISIAEGFKEYLINMGRKIIVLVKNKNIQKNFMNELLSKCTSDEYLTDEQRELYFTNDNDKKNWSYDELVNKTHKKINKTYQFITYGSFVNRVLGAKDYIKDEMGRNTNKVKKEDNKIKRKTIKEQITSLSNRVIIVDEAHNITNNDVYTALYQVLSNSFNTRLILLTATPIYDNIKEIFELSNLLNFNNTNLQFPVRNDLNNYIEKTQSNLINNSVLKGGVNTITQFGMDALKKALAGKVSYVKSNTLTYPTQIDKGEPLIYHLNVVYCNMSFYQYKTYIKALNQDVIRDSQYDLSIVIQNTEASDNLINENENETENIIYRTSNLYKNCSDASTMSYPDNTYGKEGFTAMIENENQKHILTSKNLQNYSSKLYTLLNNIHKSPGNIFIYSNYVSFGGTNLIKQLLLANGYYEFKSKENSKHHYKCFFLFDEHTTVDKREQYRRLFNSSENSTGKFIKIIIGSPIISEGITLKNIRQVHLLEPNWNMSKTNQIIGRAVRNQSHHALPLEDRNVEIYKYVSIFQTTNPDVLKKINSKKLYTFFIDKEKYILCAEKDQANKRVEHLLQEISFDRENENENVIDKSTYNLYINTFEKYDIEYVLNILRDLFKKYFIWNLNDIIHSVLGYSSNISKETIFYTLNYAVKHKIPFIDIYLRDGFIINKGDFYIFNSSDIDIESSLFAKTLDFTVNKSKYTLNEFTQKKLDTNLLINDKDKDNDNDNDNDNDDNNDDDNKISDIDIQYNQNIIKKYDIFGSYRARGTVDNPFGPVDNTFRLIDLRNNKLGDNDKRKNISGMAISSYKKPKLLNICMYLKLDGCSANSKYDKHQLAEKIQKFLVDKNRVLK